MGHDQVWKEIIWTFFEPFIKLFYPQVADAIDFSTAQLVEGEVFTDTPEGSRREPDLVVEVRRTDGAPEIILVHVAVQSERREEIPYRMWEYYSLLRLRKKLPVFPIVVYLVPGSGGLVSETYREELFGKRMLEFEYEAVGLPDLPAEAYNERDDPLAVSLSALMSSPQGSRVRRKFRALERLSTAGLDDARTHMLKYVVEQYLSLTELEEAEMNQMITDPTTPEFFEKFMTKRDKVAWDRGIEQGIEQGIQRERNLLLRLLTRRMGPMPANVAGCVETLTLDQLDQLGEALFDLNSYADVEAWFSRL